MEASNSIFSNNKSRVLSLFFAVFLISATTSAQTFKTQVKYVDPAQTALNAALVITEIQKNDFDAFVTKIEALGMYSVTKEFSEQKNTGTITLKSNAKAEIRDLESSLKQLDIHTVEFNGKTISSQQIQANYVPVNKTEVRHIERRK